MIDFNPAVKLADKEKQIPEREEKKYPSLSKVFNKNISETPIDCEMGVSSSPPTSRKLPSINKILDSQNKGENKLNSPSSKKLSFEEIPSKNQLDKDLMDNGKINESLTKLSRDLSELQNPPQPTPQVPAEGYSYPPQTLNPGKIYLRS